MKRKKLDKREEQAVLCLDKAITCLEQAKRRFLNNDLDTYLNKLCDASCLIRKSEESITDCNPICGYGC